MAVDPSGLTVAAPTRSRKRPRLPPGVVIFNPPGGSHPPRGSGLYLEGIEGSLASFGNLTDGQIVKRIPSHGMEIS